MRSKTAECRGDVVMVCAMTMMMLLMVVTVLETVIHGCGDGKW